VKKMLNYLWWFFTPDSVFSTERLAKGEWDAIPSLLKNSFKRAIFIMPGIYAVGVRGKQLVGASILGSLGVSASLVIYFLANPDYSTDLCEDTQ
tara:strand:- start:199 stop:480 length:282 start_codon:yes stop_codon:yes gene_type:complete